MTVLQQELVLSDYVVRPLRKAEKLLPAINQA